MNALGSLSVWAKRNGSVCASVRAGSKTQRRVVEHEHRAVVATAGWVCDAIRLIRVEEQDLVQVGDRARAACLALEYAVTREHDLVQMYALLAAARKIVRATTNLEHAHARRAIQHTLRQRIGARELGALRVVG
jgi:hypothetical protein